MLPSRSAPVQRQPCPVRYKLGRELIYASTYCRDVLLMFFENGITRRNFIHIRFVEVAIRMISYPFSIRRPVFNRELLVHPLPRGSTPTALVRRAYRDQDFRGALAWFAAQLEDVLHDNRAT